MMVNWMEIGVMVKMGMCYQRWMDAGVLCIFSWQAVYRYVGNTTSQRLSTVRFIDSIA